VFKLIDAQRFEYAPMDLSVNVEGVIAALNLSVWIHRPHNRVVTSNRHERSSHARKIYSKVLVLDGACPI